MSKLKKILLQLELNIEHCDVANLQVSKSTIGWQIDHSLRVVNGIILQLKNSNKNDYKWQFNFKRLLIFSLNKIPRGKGTAPKSVQSYEKIIEQDLVILIEISKKLISEIESLPKNSNFKHPYFGVLNLKQSIKFLNIHTNHHLKIVNDILNK